MINDTVQIIICDYWYVESKLLRSGTTLVIDDYTVSSEEAAVATFRANDVTDVGAFAQAQTSFVMALQQ